MIFETRDIAQAYADFRNAQLSDCEKETGYEAI
jgi:hypothetical protein